MKNSYALATVFVAVLIDLLGFGIVLPLLPFYATSLQATPFTVGLLYSIYSFAQLIFSPVWGSISDRVGRRPIMLISTMGAVLAYILFGLAKTLFILFLSRFIAGIMGGNVGTAQAYIADITTKEERAKGMGLIGAAYGIGFMIGPAVGALLIHPAFTNFFGIAPENKFSIPGFAAAGLSFISFLLVLFKLPETVKSDQHTRKKINARPSVFTVVFWRNILIMNRSGHKYLFAMLLGSFFLFSFSQSSLYSSFPLYCKYQCALTAEEVGILFAFMGLIAVIIQGGLIRHLVGRYGEEKLFFAGTVLAVAGYVMIPFSFQTQWLYAVMGLLGIGWSLNGPTVSSLISKEADTTEVGMVMGTSQGISALGRVIGPTWGGVLYAMGYFWPFLATSILLSATIFVGIRLLMIGKVEHA